MDKAKFANLDAREGSLNGTRSISFIFKASRIQFMNDSDNDLFFRFNPDETYATVYPREAVTVDIATRGVTLQANGDYRVWAFG